MDETIQEFIDRVKQNYNKAIVLTWYKCNLHKAIKNLEKLQEALLGHRWDLHNRSKRPCPTCRQSAKALGLDVPDHCAYKGFDTQALKKG